MAKFLNSKEEQYNLKIIASIKLLVLYVHWEYLRLEIIVIIGQKMKMNSL